MSVNYAKYRAMTPAHLQRAIDEREVTVEYLSWLGITGKGALAREIISEHEGRKKRPQGALGS